MPSEIFQDVNQNQSQRLIGSVHASWRPFAWMQNDGNVGVDYNNRTGIFLCRYRECPASGTLRLGSTSSSTSNNRNFSAKVTSTSTWQAKSSANLKTTFGSDYTNVENDGTSASGTQLAAGRAVGRAAAVTSASNTLWTATKTWGYYAQEQVALRDRLFLTAAVRADQNSAFGTNFQSVVYPKVSLSWIAVGRAVLPENRSGWISFAFAARTARRACSLARRRRSITFSSTTVNQP